MPGHCAAMAAMRDLDEIYEHMSGFCHDCIDAQLEEAANGEELIFTEGPPSWIAAQEARESEAKAERERQEEMERKRNAIEKKREKEGGGKVNWTSAEDAKKEEIRKLAGQLSDRHLEQEIKKLMRVDGAEAAQMRLELKREMAMKRKEKEKKEDLVEAKQQIKAQKEEQKKNPEGPKEMNKFQKRPWQPQILKAIAIGDERRSALTVEEQKRYVAILSNFHQLEAKVRFEQNKKDLKIYDERMATEREVMDAMLMEHLKTSNVSTMEVQKEMQVVLRRWGARYLNEQRRFERIKEIQWRREAETPPTHGVLKPTLDRLLLAAPSPKLTLPPNMHERLPVNSDPYRFQPQNKRQTAIVDDKTLSSLCLDTGCTIAMESTTAVHLMTRPAEPRNYDYNVPISVFDQFKGGSVVRMCFLGKPRPQSFVTSLTLLHMVAKYRVKCTFTQKDTEAPPKPGTSRDTVATGTGKDTVAASEDTVATTSANKEEEEGGGGFSLLDNLLGSMTSSAPSSSALGAKAPPTKASTTSHSYGLYTIPSFTEPETKVLVRFSPCLRNVTAGGTEYSLNAKVELVPEAGVTRETFEEMLWTSMKTIFKGAVNSATIHMHPYMKDALQISHSRAVPQGNQYNEGFHPLVSTRTEHFSRLLRELSKLETGEYLLQVSTNSDDMVVFRENPKGNELFFNKAPKSKAPPSIKPLDTFAGIDDKRVLHWQVMQGRAPLSLWPENHHMLKTYEQEREKGQKGGGVKRKFEHNDKSKMTEEQKKKFNFQTHQRKKSAKQRKRAQGQGPKDWDAPA